jgi:hypothetical protein
VFLTPLLLEAARTVSFGLVSLNAEYDEANRATWPTVGLVKQQMTQFGTASPHRIEDLVAQLIHNGCLESVPSGHDRRARLLAPTAKMLTTDKRWLAAHHLPLNVVFPATPLSVLRAARRF